jgi:hypothetical protein
MHLNQDREMFRHFCGLDMVYVFDSGMITKQSSFCLAPFWTQDDLVLCWCSVKIFFVQ